MKKYREAWAWMAGSAPIHTGIKGLRAMEAPPQTTPQPTDRIRACWASFPARPRSPAPTAWEIRASTAVAAEAEMLLTSQVMVVVTLTAAVARCGTGICSSGS